MVWVQVLGWVGSVLLIISLLQTRVLRLRVLNTVAAVVLVVFNALVEVWPMAVMNAVIIVINLWQIARLRSAAHAEGYTLLEVDPTDEYLRHVLRVHEREIRQFFPDFVFDPAAQGSAFLILRGDETAGVVLLQDGDSPGMAQLDLDYVTPKYRDFTPAEFVYERSGWFAEHGYERVTAPPSMSPDDPYLPRLGYERQDDRWVRPV
ncbi:MAG: YgjV family protein [Jiangellales bacterium]